MEEKKRQLPLFEEPKEEKLIKLSTSKVKTFDHCQAQYKYNYIEHLPKKEWEHHSFGLFLHAVLENFHLEFLNGSTENYAVVMSRIYKSILPQYTAKLTKELKKEAYDIIAHYLQKISINPKEVEHVIAVEKRFEIKINNRITLVGMIDKVTKDDYDVVWVQDYKTIKNKKYLKNDFLQLKTYAYALFMENPALEKVRASYVLLRHNFELISTEFSADILKEIEDEYKDFAEKIEQEKLYRPNPGPLCKFCDFLDVCEEGKNFVNRGTKKHGKVSW